MPGTEKQEQATVCRSDGTYGRRRAVYDESRANVSCCVAVAGRAGRQRACLVSRAGRWPLMGYAVVRV